MGDQCDLPHHQITHTTRKDGNKMVTEYGTKVKRFVYEMANWYKKDATKWQQDRIDAYVQVHECGVITTRECVRKIVETIEDMGAHYTFDELDHEAQDNCIDQFLGIMCPYDTDGSLEGATRDELRTTINAWIGDQFWVDKNGNWYDEGRMVR